jgi:phage terminase small subunit
MAIRGRKPKPLALKILEGHQASKTNFAEPRLPSGSIVAPDTCQGTALDKWNELAPLLATAGMLTQGDRTALEQLCLDYQFVRDFPDARTVNVVLARLMRTLAEFGLTPSSRSRIKSTQGPPKDKLDEYFARKPGKREA